MSDGSVDSAHVADRVPVADRISIRAVLVAAGQDASDALTRAGLIDAVTLPAVLGDEVSLPGGILGDGLTPNVIGVLETEQQDGWNQPAGMRPASGSTAASATQPSQAASTTMLPAAFGMQPLAPIRNRAS